MRKLFEAYNRLAHMGDASLVLDLMTEDVTVLIPFPNEYGTEQRGKAAAEAAFLHASAGLGLKADSTLASPIMVGAGIGGFEYVACGVSGGNAIDLPALLVFEERDGKVASAWVLGPQSGLVRRLSPFVI